VIALAVGDMETVLDQAAAASTVAVCLGTVSQACAGPRSTSFEAEFHARAAAR
jgi:hypothetical protein